MIEKKLTNEKCPECKGGVLQEQFWGDKQRRITCSNPECPHTEYRWVK